MAEEESRYGNVPVGDTFKFKGNIYKVIRRTTCWNCDLASECLKTSDGIFACWSAHQDDHIPCSFKLVRHDSNK